MTGSFPTSASRSALMSGGIRAGLSAQEWCTVIVAITVASLPAVMPAMVAAMASQAQIGVEGAGYLVSANMAGIFTGTLISALVRGRALAARLVRFGLLVMAAGNLVTAVTGTMPGLLAVRLVSGLGEGFAAGICFSLLAQSQRVGRVFAIYTAGQGLVGAIGMATLPWLVGAFDWRAFYIAMAVIAIPALFLAGMAARGGLAAADIRSVDRISPAGWTSLTLIFLFFTGMALIWAFLQRIGELHELSLVLVSGALATGSLASLAGSMLVALGADRLPDRVGFGIGLTLLFGAAAGLWSNLGAGFVVGVWLLNLVWGFQYPFLFRMLARTDPGKGAGVTPVATGIALSVGPALGGEILARGGIAAACAAFLLLTLGALAVCLVRTARSMETVS